MKVRSAILSLLLAFSTILSSCTTHQKIQEQTMINLHGDFGPPYKLRTKIFIGVDIDQNGKQTANITEDEVEKLIVQTEVCFHPLYLYMFINIEYVDLKNFVTQDQYKAKAKEYPDCYCIFFIPEENSLMKNFSGITGLSAIDQEGGYTIIYNKNDFYVLAHELGHHLGLGHTFEGDGIDDTFDGADATYANIMNYSIEAFQTFTPGQFRKMQEVLETTKKHELIIGGS